ncbi:MAG TPA: hypothetical protein VGM39_13725 [Kofleriaceae bacterium]
MTRPPNHRRERIVRVQSKRPAPPEVRVTYAPPRPGSLDELADLVLSMLDKRTHSRRG